MRLIQYRDAGLHTYTYFWVSEDDRVISPYFDTAQQAEKWIGDQAKDHDIITDKSK
jgi:hypothetical protein